ncbi:MAG: SH3 domain-containing protein, partial [Butyrivibrio sp.]|nr:SH3 domain-containing protein [Butyrivibrio sp.]
MKRKLVCLMISAILLCQPIQANAAETKPDLETVSENTQEDETAQDSEDAQKSETEQESKSDENNADEETDTQESAAQPKESGNGVRDALSAPVGISSVVETKSKEDYVKAYEAAKNANWGYTNLGIADVSNNLNIRAIPAADGKLVGKLPKDAACEVLDSDGEWAHIKSGKVEGYVSCEYLLTGLNAKWRAEELVSTIATVTADSLRVRGEASTDADIITTVPKGEELEVVESLGDWIK